MSTDTESKVTEEEEQVQDEVTDKAESAAPAKEDEAPVEESSAPEETPAEPAPADEEQAEEPPESAAEALDTETWGDTGDPTGNAVLQALQDSKAITPEEAIGMGLADAITSGDLQKADREALAAKVGQATADLVMAGIENVLTRREARIAEVSAVVHETAGGKEAWDAVTAWANKNVDKADLDEYAALIDKGGLHARLAAQDLTRKYAADPKTTTLPKTRLQGDSTHPGGSGEAITRAQYFDRLQALHRQGTPDPAELQSIKAARQRGRAQGI